MTAIFTAPVFSKIAFREFRNKEVRSTPAISSRIFNGIFTNSKSELPSAKYVMATVTAHIIAELTMSQNLVCSYRKRSLVRIANVMIISESVDSTNHAVRSIAGSALNISNKGKSSARSKMNLLIRNKS